MRFIRVEQMSGIYLINPLKITRLYSTDDIITLWFGNDDTLELYKSECINFKEVKEQILKNL